MQNIENDDLKIKFIRLIRQMIYEWRFEELINLIKGKYPSFFVTNQNIFYIIMKFRFIKIILFQHDIEAAQNFYSKTLASIMKKIYRNKTSSYNKKHFKYQYFLNQINNNNEKYILFRQHFKSQIYLDKFINLLEKELHKEQEAERNSVIFNVTKYNDNNNLSKINNNSGKPLFKTEHVNILTYKHENMSEIEDELFKLNLGETKKIIFNIYSLDNKSINKNNIYINSTNSIDIDSNSNNNNDEFNNNNYSDISNNNTNPEINNSIINNIDINQNKLDSKKFLEKNDFSSFDNKEKCNFNSKIRRVNLCKKIVRKFKKYLKLNIKEINYPFWNSFCRENYLPPFKLEDIEFKSFSRIYLNWLFSHEGGIELYNNFLRNKGDEELNNIYINYCINDLEEKNDLKNFFINFAIFFSGLKNNDNENEIENNNLNNDENKLTNNNNFNNEKSFQADCANNFFDNFIHKKENNNNLSIGSIKNFYNYERDYNRGSEAKNYEVCNKALISDSSNSSMENANFDFNVNKNNNNNSDKEYNYEYNKIYDNINLENYHYDFSENQNIKFHNNNENNNIYPDSYFFGLKNYNNINASFQNNLFNSNENICDKNYDNIKED